MLGDDVDVTQGTFEEHGIQEGANVYADLIPRIQTREQVQTLVNEIIGCNPGIDHSRLMPAATFDADGNLRHW